MQISLEAKVTQCTEEGWKEAAATKTLMTGAAESL